MAIASVTGLIITACMIPAFFCAGFYYGFNTAQGVFTQAAVTKENIPGGMLPQLAIQKIKDGRHTETEYERLQRILAENVENFGTDVPQKEVV